MRSRFLEQRELSALRAVGAAVWLPFKIALETGLRVGDIVKIRWRDIEGNKLKYTAEKTGKRGEAILTWQTVADLRRLHANSNSIWVFPSPRRAGRHITRQTLWYRFKRAARRAHIPLGGASPHSLRKVYAVREFRAHGARAASAALQHTNLATTEIYIFSDWATGENAKLPLLREDIPRLCQIMEDLVISKITKKAKK